MINLKWTKTSLKIICNEKETQWMHITFHCKGRFGIVKMLAKTPWDLDLYPTVDHIQMKVINVDYNVKMGYWASKNNLKKYKVYVTMIRMFNLKFVNNLRQALGDNLCG
jgi:hypothetical protein